MFKGKKIRKSGFGSHFIFLLLALLGGGLVLSGCTVYNGYPTAQPETAMATPRSSSVNAATYPPLPSPTPRPTLPPVPTNITPTKTKVLQDGYNSLLTRYFQTLNSADLYEVGLNGIRDALVQAGISQPAVPIPAFSGNSDQDWNTFLQAYTLALSRYNSTLSEDKFAYAALSRSTQILQDCQVPQTAFYPPDQADTYLRSRTGQSQYTGVGVVLSPFDANQTYLVTHVFSGLPAEKSGLKLGDAVLAVDGTKTANLEYTQVVGLILGNNAAPGSKVSLNVQRAGSGKQETLEITRATIQLPTVETALLPDNIGYLRFNSFPFDTDSGISQYLNQFDRIVNNFNSQGVKGFILDLRGNTGGNVNLVQGVLSRFVSGTDLATLAARDSQGRSGTLGLPSLNSVKATDKPVSVLVDSTTGNEAEIFALAIQNKRKGSVFGQPTAGCVAASLPFRLTDNSLINILAWHSLDNANDPSSLTAAVLPDVPVALDQKALTQGQDSILDKAVQYIKTQ